MTDAVDLALFKALLSELAMLASDGDPWTVQSEREKQVERTLIQMYERATAETADAHPEESCERCHRPNVTWFAPSELWNKAVRAVDGPGILCPVCFMQLAEAAGIRPTAWRVAPE